MEHLDAVARMMKLIYLEHPTTNAYESEALAKKLIAIVQQVADERIKVALADARVVGDKVWDGS